MARFFFCLHMAIEAFRQGWRTWRFLEHSTRRAARAKTRAVFGYDGAPLRLIRGGQAEQLSGKGVA